jgi:hypothetical protein
MYELIKEYPGSPKLGEVIDWDYLNCGDGRVLYGIYWIYNIDKYPEFYKKIS